jgi:hypothetical protein
MTSPRRKPVSPVESIELKVYFRADKVTAAKVKGLFPSAVVKDGTCHVEIEGDDPGAVAAKAKVLLDSVRGT